MKRFVWPQYLVEPQYVEGCFKGRWNLPTRFFCLHQGNITSLCILTLEALGWKPGLLRHYLRLPKLTHFECWAADAKQFTLRMNKDRREKDPDAHRWRRGINDRRRGIYTFPVAIRLVHSTSSVNSTIAVHSPVVVIPGSSVLITALVVFSPIFVIFGKGRRHVYTADHCRQDKPHHNPARYGSEIP